MIEAGAGRAVPRIRSALLVPASRPEFLAKAAGRGADAVMVLVEVRAAGVPNPVTGLVSVLDDPGLVESFAAQSRGLGYEGMMCIHPSQVAVANAAFSPSEEEVGEARAVLDALADAEAHGQAVISYGGKVYNSAHPPELAPR